jgi:hypothetical protein
VNAEELFFAGRSVGARRGWAPSRSKETEPNSTSSSSSFRHDRRRWDLLLCLAGHDATAPQPRAKHVAPVR